MLRAFRLQEEDGKTPHGETVRSTAFSRSITGSFVKYVMRFLEFFLPPPPLSFPCYVFYEWPQFFFIYIILHKLYYVYTRGHKYDDGFHLKPGVSKKRKRVAYTIYILGVNAFSERVRSSLKEKYVRYSFSFLRYRTAEGVSPYLCRPRVYSSKYKFPTWRNLHRSA